jgi:hypothetical protein
MTAAWENRVAPEAAGLDLVAVAIADDVKEDRTSPVSVR